VYILFFSKWLLPDTEAPSLHDEVLVGLKVPKGSRHAGHTGARTGSRFDPLHLPRQTAGQATRRRQAPS